MRAFEMPKVELHCHLDGSLRPETVLELAKQMHIKLPDESIEAVRASLIAPSDCDSLDTYLKRFDLPIEVMQTETALERVAYELMADASKENVKYIEIRFAPQQHMAKGLNYNKVIESVVKGVKRAELEFEIKGNVILSYLRHTDVQGIYDMIDAGQSLLGNGVVAVDLCAGESDLFASRFKEAFSYARGLGYRVTIHAGETGIARNMTESILLLGAERIGHGVAMMDDAEAYACVKSNNVVLECCPTSNLQTKAILDIKAHPIRAFYEDGILVTLNTDNRTVSGTDMTHEFEIVHEAFDYSDRFDKQVYRNSVQGAFADDATKAWLLTLLES